MKTAFLVPNTSVRDPRTKEPLAEGGQIKVMIGSEGRYWRRRLRDGSIKISKQLVIPKAEKRRMKGKED